MSYETEISKIEEIKKIDGSVRGVALKTDEFFVMKSGGEEALTRVESFIKELGFDIKYEEIDKMAFYPLSWRIASLLAVSREFNFDKKGIAALGEMAPKSSFLIKFFVKHFMSVERTLAKVSQIWEKHYTVGRMEAVLVDEEKKEAVFRLHDMTTHPIMCDYLTGYLAAVVTMVIGEKAVAEERVCPERGGDFHEYYITWREK